MPPPSFDRLSKRLPPLSTDVLVIQVQAYGLLKQTRCQPVQMKISDAYYLTKAAVFAQEQYIVLTPCYLI